MIYCRTIRFDSRNSPADYEVRAIPILVRASGRRLKVPDLLYFRLDNKCRPYFLTVFPEPSPGRRCRDQDHRPYDPNDSGLPALAGQSRFAAPHRCLDGSRNFMAKDTDPNDSFAPFCENRPDLLRPPPGETNLPTEKYCCGRWCVVGAPSFAAVHLLPL